LLLLVSPVHAAQTLSSAVLVEQVLAANASLSARAAEREAAHQRSLYASALDDPRLSYGIAPETVGSALGSRHILEFSQALPWPGKRSLRQRLADDATAIADTRVTTQRKTLIAQARTLWAEWWYVHRAMQLNVATEAVVERLIPVTEAQYGSGSGLQQDVLVAQTRKQRVRLQALRLNQQRRRLQAAINALRGRHPSETVPKPAAISAVSALPPEETLRQQLAVADPRLQTLSARQQAANTQTALAKRELYPDMNLGMGYVGTLDPDEKRLQLKLSFNLPLNRAKRKAEVRASRAEELRFEQERLDLLARLEGELSQAIASVNEANAAAALYRNSLVPRARQTLRAAQADYESGRGDFANIVVAETQLLELQLELARTRADQGVALAIIDRLTDGAVWPQAGNFARNEELN